FGDSYNASVSGQRDHFVIDDRRHVEADGVTRLRERKLAIRAQRANPGDSATARNGERRLLRTNRVEAAEEAARHVRICIVEDVQRVAGLGLPGEGLDNAVAVEGDEGRVAAQPSHGVLQQQTQVRVARTPEGAIDVAGEIGAARAAALLEDRGRLIGPRRAWK